MGWERRGQHVSKLGLHAKQVYLMPQSLNPASSTPSDTFLTNTQPPSQTPGLGGGVGGLERGSNRSFMILLLIMPHLCPGKGIYLEHFQVSAPL